MASISAYDSASIGVLFSSLNGGNNRSFSMGGSDLLGINYSDYASIRSGSYFKLLDAYYGKGREIKGVTEKLSTSTSKDDTKTLAKIEDRAGDMREASDALRTKGSKSPFEKVSVTDERGVTSKEYDTDKIYKAVDKFVKDYNSLLEEAGDSDTASIRRAAKRMTNDTRANEKMLSQLGITVDADQKLSIDEKTFKKSDMEKVKALFQGQGSYGYQIGSQASMIESFAKNEASKANTYGRSGAYTYNYNTGEMYQSSI